MMRAQSATFYQLEDLALVRAMPPACLMIRPAEALCHDVNSQPGLQVPVLNHNCFSIISYNPLFGG